MSTFLMLVPEVKLFSFCFIRKNIENKMVLVCQLS
uniref:Uncharacterized protein n=1 Tax=Arundo donax TaxID=35708 RepID=A0A0A9EN62_ARUDO